MAVNITAVLDIAAALSQEGHPSSAKHLRDAVAEIERLFAERVGLPGGWQAVPVRPTMDMLGAGRVVLISSSEVWAAMLAAAPPPPEIGVEKSPTVWKNAQCNGNPEVGREAE